MNVLFLASKILESTQDENVCNKSVVNLNENSYTSMRIYEMYLNNVSSTTV